MRKDHGFSSGAASLRQLFAARVGSVRVWGTIVSCLFLGCASQADERSISEAPAGVEAGRAAEPRLEVRLDRGQVRLGYELPAHESAKQIAIIHRFPEPSLFETRKPIFVLPFSFSTAGSFIVPELGEGAQAFFSISTEPDSLSSTMVWIPPGSFMMGSSVGEQDRYVDEGPQRFVAIEKGYWIGKFEVTQAEFESVMLVNPSKLRTSPKHPVENLTWGEAQRYCEVLTEREKAAGRLPRGYVYRLPTEAEWEYACRAGTVTRFSFGDDPYYKDIGEYCVYITNNPNGTYSVGALKPNAWGLHDMHGNVFEWCHEWYDAYPGGKAFVTNPRTRIYRGGSWICEPHVCRSAVRFHGSNERGYMIGFRVVLGTPVEE